MLFSRTPNLCGIFQSLPPELGPSYRRRGHGCLPRYRPSLSAPSRRSRRSNGHPLDLLAQLLAPCQSPQSSLVPCSDSYLALCSDSCRTVVPWSASYSVMHRFIYCPSILWLCIGSCLVYVNRVEAEVQSTRGVGDPRRPRSRACQIVSSSIVGIGN